MVLSIYPIYWGKWAIGLWGVAILWISGCGTSGKPLKVRLQNSGGYPVIAFYVQPAGTITPGDEDVARWGVNRLTVPRLDAGKYVVLMDMPRQNLDGFYVFDDVGTTKYLRRDQLRADWLDEECVTFTISLSVNGSGGGHQWGCTFDDPQNEVKP